MSRSRIKIGDIVRSFYKAGWYGKVFEVEKRKLEGDLITCIMFCTADGRPQRKLKRKRLDEAWLEVVEAPPERFTEMGGTIPESMGNIDVPGGTPRAKFTDHFKMDQRVWVERYRHGWRVGYGKIVHLTDDQCSVKLEESGGVININHVRDLFSD